MKRGGLIAGMPIARYGLSKYREAPGATFRGCPFAGVARLGRLQTKGDLAVTAEAAALPQTDTAPPQKAVSARASWNFEDRDAKLLALGARDGRTVDFDKMVQERHAREPEIVARLQ